MSLHGFVSGRIAVHFAVERAAKDERFSEQGPVVAVDETVIQSKEHRRYLYLVWFDRREIDVTIREMKPA